MTSWPQFCYESFDYDFGICLFDWFVGFFCHPTWFLLSLSFFFQTSYFPQQSQPVTSDHICFQCTSFSSTAFRLVLLNGHQFDLVSFSCLILCLACSIPFKPLPSWSVQLVIDGQNYKQVDGKLYRCINTRNHQSIKKTSMVKN